MANERMLQYWGLTAQDCFDQPLLKVVPELETQGFGKMMNKVYETGEPFISGEIPVKLTRFGKEEISYIHLTVEPLRNEEEKITGMIAVAAEVTEQVIARQELEKATDTLKLALEAANLGTWRTDWGTDNLFVSDIARNIHGIPLGTVLSFDETLNVVVPEHRGYFMQAILDAVATKGRFSENYQVQPFDGGKRKWINSTGKVELNAAGEVTGVIGTILDITESKEDSERKDDFIGMVSHELKTPLTTLTGYAQILLRHAAKNDDRFANEKLEKVSTQVRKMSKMISGFLNVSRLEAGKIHLDKHSFELNELILEAIEDAESNVHSHEIEFEKMPEMMLCADRDKIESVVSNLISNAIKYSPKGKQIQIECKQQGDFVLISVTDQGMGIKAEDCDKLFDRYYRVESNQMQNIAGFGIGLYLSAEIIKRHGGKIWVESEPGIGSTFCFTLPVQ